MSELSDENGAEAGAEEAPKRRRSGIVVVLLACLVAVAVVVGLAAAIRAGLVPPDYLPDFVQRRLAPAEQPPADAGRAPVPPTADVFAGAAPELRAALFAAATTDRDGFRLARIPAVPPAVLCDVMNASALSRANWAPDPVIPGEWTCFTDLLSVGGDIEEDPSSVFGFIRGRNRGRVDVLRLTVAYGGPTSTVEARNVAKGVFEAMLKKAAVPAPDGFLARIGAGEPDDRSDGGYRFESVVSRDDRRLDVILTATADPGFMPTGSFSGRLPPVRGVVAPAAVEVPSVGVEEDGSDATAAVPEAEMPLPPGFEDVTPEEFDAAPPEFDEAQPSGGEEPPPSDGETPIDNLTR